MACEGQSTSNLIDLALTILSCTQKELAAHLKVSATQISKWKNGDYMSTEMEGRIRKLTRVGEFSPNVILWAGSVENAERWNALFAKMGDVAVLIGESSYETPFLRGNPLLITFTVEILNDMGVAAPKRFPDELASDDDDKSEMIEENPYTNLVFRLYRSLVNVSGFFYAYIAELLNENEVSRREPSLLWIAASKLRGVDPEFAPKFQECCFAVREEFSEWIVRLKEASFRAGIPLRVELMDLINYDDETLRLLAEENVFEEDNEEIVHPDVYMNELLIGVRTLTVMVSVIMEKLGVTVDDMIEHMQAEGSTGPDESEKSGKNLDDPPADDADAEKIVERRPKNGNGKMKPGLQGDEDEE